MEINIRIDHKGHATGTVGWLAENATSIRIGTSKGGKQCAWLIGRDDKPLTILAMRDALNLHDYAPQYAGVSLVQATNMPPELTLDFAATEAAWEIIKRLAEIAKAYMDEAPAIAESYKVLVTA